MIDDSTKYTVIHGTVEYNLLVVFTLIKVKGDANVSLVLCFASICLITTQQLLVLVIAKRSVWIGAI